VADPAVRAAQVAKPLVGPPWASGWHPNVALDYAATLGAHTSAFAPKTKAELSALIATTFPAGTKVSAFMYGFDTGDGGHKVHRNAGDDDGAIVALGSGAPRWLLFHFAQQTF
jgi:hypothetical protein